MTTDWLNLGEAAQALGVHPATLRTWADSGEIPSQRTPGGHRRFRREDLDAWLAADVRVHSAGAQVIVQTTLGRARLVLAEGEASHESWHQHLDPAVRRNHQETGRRLLNLVMRYLSRDGKDETVLAEGREIGREYERMGRESGLSLAETVQAFLFFSEFLFQTTYDMTEAAGTHGPTDWGKIRRQITLFTNEVLLALIEAHSCEKSSH
ncbi:MAG: helix-turn-helix domain-containing protein [Chloroflexi bacterium]|nr:helix-turn-helix domain-containing protein [Chloroflexota bacterium]MCI0575846.1 helix-turn-helix domain-containing protein [Chloroflexota bacterium]MCI0646573.1 helix-turn-helix domain-containing protein [Chloroflexota bacterium]MCI0726375.1 helix-turn-helix domain-containing protein [Chloroflexota bacterium]